MRYYYIKKIEKQTENAFSILKTYWEEFAKLNQDKERLTFPQRNQIMKASHFNRRNAYKHIHKLIFYHIFIEEEGRLVPTSFLFEINGKVFNPSSYLFEEILPRKLRKEEVYLVNPKIKAKNLVGLLEKVELGNNSLRDYLNISIGAPEVYPYTQDYHYSELPKTLRMIEGWKQKNHKIAEQEKKLLKLISPANDPFRHNTAFFLIPNSSSPFIQIDKVNRDYVLAAWCSHIVGDELKGCPDDRQTTNSSIEFYDQEGEVLGQEDFVFDHQGLNLMTDLLVVSGRIKTSGNLLGWYDFKNNIPAGKRVHNHILISFVRIKMPEKTAYFKIRTGERSYFAFVSLFPLSKFPQNFINQRMNQDKGFVQNSEPIFYYQKGKGIRNLKSYSKMNDLLIKASFIVGEKKNELLRKALENLDVFSKTFRLDVEKAMKSKKISEELLDTANSAFDARLLLSLAIRDKDEKLKKKLIKEIIKDYHLAQKMIHFLRNEDLFLEQILILLITNFRQYRDVKFYLKRDLELANLRKIVKENKNLIDKSSNFELKIELYRWLINFERIIIENQLSRGRKVDLSDAKEIFASLAEVYSELARHIKKFNPPESQKKLFQNKYWLYRSQSLFHTLSEILFKAKVFAQTSGDTRIKELLTSLQELEKKLF